GVDEWRVADAPQTSGRCVAPCVPSVLVAACRARRRRLENWEPWLVFVVPVKCASADSAVAQPCTPRDLVGEPVKAIRHVRVEHFETGHLADFWRNAHEMTGHE